ncbi:chemotaxis protein CheW [Cytophagaceae bacterium DM2B3-1]|uniref:Chemotaxis protein CheW n=1 Tax=Xanthocytophaga flava TaxID=3048013 RepID=A0ABT7CJJ1_9BACT|nr:chemotaxis protein CheW [Xanthocytophaga flavus]MDJ1493870.1 chemotaxis protein CheW [Xanthocytophaga flavus]
MSTESVSIQSYLSFKLGQEIFAANVLTVNEVLEVGKITKVPHAPAFMRGVTNLRGTVLPVIDTRVKFGMTPVAETQDSCIIVLTIAQNVEANGEAGKHIVIGALVDSVVEVFEASQEQIKPLPAMGVRYNANFIKGTFKVGEDFIMFLDIDKVFSSEELVVLNNSEEVASA